MIFESYIKCINCKKQIKSKYILSCTCGSFCSPECFNTYQHKEAKIETICPSIQANDITKLGENKE